MYKSTCKYTFLLVWFAASFLLFSLSISFPFTRSHSRSSIHLRLCADFLSMTFSSIFSQTLSIRFLLAAAARLTFGYVNLLMLIYWECLCASKCPKMNKNGQKRNEANNRPKRRTTTNQAIKANEESNTLNAHQIKRKVFLFIEYGPVSATMRAVVVLNAFLISTGC